MVEFLDSDREHMQFMRLTPKRMFELQGVFPDEHPKQDHLLHSWLNFDGVSHLMCEQE